MSCSIENLHADVLGFHDLTINVTGFSGIELLQVTKAVTLFGMRIVRSVRMRSDKLQVPRMTTFFHRK